MMCAPGGQCGTTPTLLASVSAPVAIAVDLDGANVFWTDGVDGTVSSCRTTGCNLAPTYSLPKTKPLRPASMHALGQRAFIGRRSAVYSRGGLDVSAATTPSAPTFFAVTTTRPLDLTVDCTNLYWTGEVVGKAHAGGDSSRSPSHAPDATRTHTTLTQGAQSSSFGRRQTRRACIG